MPKAFMIRLLKQGSRFLSAAYNYTEAADGPVTGPYRQGQFKVSFFTSGDRVCAVAEVPTPSAPTQCRVIGFSVKTDGTEPVYRTVELNSDGTYCLCGWTEDHVHLNTADVGCELPEIEDAMVKALTAVVDDRVRLSEQYEYHSGPFMV
jgi:hypothetical protein